MEGEEGSMIRLRHGLSPTTTASDEAEVYARKVENMKTRLLTINEKIIQHELRSIEEQHKVGCDGLGKGRKIETEKQIEKTLKMMQEIGNKKLVVLNTKISHNRELRRKIDEMRQERCRLDVIYTKLERDVQCQTEQMYMVLEEGKNAIKARDNAIGELEALNKQFEEGRSALRLEQDDLSKLAEQFRREDEKVPSRRRTGLERRVTRPHTSSSRKTNEDDEEDQNMEIEEYDDEKELDDALARVLGNCGAGASEQEVDKLVRSIESARDSRFGLYASIGVLEAETMINEAKISDMEKEVRRLQNHEMNTDTRWQREQHSMEERRSQAERKIKNVDAQYQVVLNTWNRLRSKVFVVHEELGLSVPEDLIGTDDVTTNNAMRYLAAIEKKMSEILAEIHGDDDEEQENHHGTSPTKGEEQIMRLVLPSATSVGECNRQVYDDERPLTMKELQESLRTAINE